MFAMLFLLLGATYTQTDVEPLTGEAWDNCKVSNVTISDYTDTKSFEVQYKYCSIDNGIPKSYFDQKFKAASEIAVNYIIQKTGKAIDCKTNTSLEVYQITVGMLNDRGRFIDFWKKHGDEKNKVFWGLYYPRANDSGSQYGGSIIVTNQPDDYYDEMVMIHEIGHYWYDRLCPGSKDFDVQESFADDFESQYFLLTNGCTHL